MCISVSLIPKKEEEEQEQEKYEDNKTEELDESDTEELEKPEKELNNHTFFVFNACAFTVFLGAILYFFPAPCQFNLYQNSEDQESEESTSLFSKALLTTLLAAGAPLLVQLIADPDDNYNKFVTVSRIVMSFVLGCLAGYGLLVYSNRDTCSLVSPSYLRVAVCMVFFMVLVFTIEINLMRYDDNEDCDDDDDNEDTKGDKDSEDSKDDKDSEDSKGDKDSEDSKSDKDSEDSKDDDDDHATARYWKLQIMKFFLHSFVGGLAIGSHYSESNAYGVLACLSLLFYKVHNHLEYISSLTIRGYSRTEALLIQLLLIMSALLGTCVSLFTTDEISTGLIQPFTRLFFIYYCGYVMVHFLYETKLRYFDEKIMEFLAATCGGLYATLIAVKSV